MQPRWITAVLIVAVAAILLSPAAASTVQSTIEDFSNASLAVYNSGSAQKAPAGSAHLYGWEVGGHYFSIQDAGSDRVMNPNSSYSGLDIGIKFTVLNSEYQPVWDEALRANAISLASASDMTFTFVNMASASRTLTSGLTVILYYYDTSAAATATASLKVLANNTAFAAGQFRTATISVDGITGFDKTADLVYGFRIYQATYNQQVAWSSVTCTITSDGLPSPNAVTDLGATNLDPRGLTLTWTAPSDPSGFPDSVASYDIRYALAPIDETNWDAATQVAGEPVPALPGTAQSCAVSGLTPGAAHYFAVKSTDAFGNVSAISNVYPVTMPPPDVTAPAVVTDLAGSVFRAIHVTLTWTASGDDGSVGTAASYDLRYATLPISDANWNTATAVADLPVPQASGTAETFTVTGLQPDTTYYFALKVNDEWPNASGISNVVTIHMPPADVWPPHPVSDLTVVGTGSRTITLGWTAPTDQGDAGVAGYDIRYSTSSIDESNWDAASQVSNEPAASTPGTVETFSVGGLESSTTYYFAVKSFDWAEPANVSAVSNFAAGTTRPPLQPVVVHNPWLVNDRVADTHNIDTMAATYVNAYTPSGVVLPASNEQKCINMYNNQKRRLYHWADEPPSVGGNSISDPTYNQNVFGWALCGRHADQGMTLAQAAGFPSRNVGVPGHNIYEVQYDGGWHLFDTMTTMYVYTIAAPRHVANLAEISADHNIMLNAVADGRACPGFLLCGDTPTWYANSADSWSIGGTTPKTARWTGNMDLRLGQALKRTWESWVTQRPTPKTNADAAAGADEPYHHEANKDWKDTVNLPYWEPYALTSAQSTALNIPMNPTYRRWANGTDALAPDFTNGGYAAMLEAASHDVAASFDDGLSPDLHVKTLGTQGEAVFKVSVPFYITDASFSGTFVKAAAADTCKVYVSSNGTTWTQVYDAPVGTTAVTNRSLRTNVFGLWSTYYLKIQLNSAAAKSNAGVSGFVVTTTFEHNKGAMAYLDKGTNNITVTFDNPAELQASRNALHIVYKWKEYDGTGWTIDRSFDFYAVASPSTFTIDVGGSKVPRTESILMEVTAAPPPCEVPPSPITDLAAAAYSSTKVQLTWTATDDPCSSDHVAAYDLRCSTTPITDDASFLAAPQVSGVPAPALPGSPESFTLTGLTGGTTYYFALKVRTISGVTSDMSNVAAITPPRPGPAPDWVGNLVARPSRTSGAVDLAWSAPASWGPDHMGPYTCTSYRLRCSTSPIAYDDGDASWNAATEIAGVPAPQAPGSAETFTVTGLTGGTTYYFAIRSLDDIGQVSQVSNCATAAASVIGEKTLQFGLGGYTGVADSYYYVSNSTNYGTQERLVVCGYGPGNYERGIVEFDLSGLPAGATITRATLSLYSYYPAQTKGSTGYYGAYPVTTDWTASQCTWTLARTGVNWTTPGGDFLAGEDATSPKKAAAGVPAWYDWDVTARVQSWMAGTSVNRGWIIKCTDESKSNQDYFYQSDTINAAYRPKLVVSDLVAPVPGDISGDSSVDVEDLLYFVESFGALCGTDRAYNPLCDFNSDGIIDVIDLLTFVQEYWPQ